MDKYHRLLVAVDGSETSLHALKESFKLARNWVAVVAVAPPYEGDLRLVGVHHREDLIKEPCTTALARAQEMADAAGATIKPLCVVGEPHQCIVAQAEAGSCDLIVIGARGHSFLETLLMGRVTRRVIGHSPTDVLVVPEEAAIGWEKILMATDGSTGSQAAAARALALAQAYGSELLVVSMVDVPSRLYEDAPEMAAKLRQAPESYVAEVTGAAAAQNLKAQGFVREGPPYQGITRLAREHQANLIVMGSHGRTGLTRLLMGSVTERVIGHAPCPVLVVKE